MVTFALEQVQAWDNGLQKEPSLARQFLPVPHGTPVPVKTAQNSWISVWDETWLTVQLTGSIGGHCCIGASASLGQGIAEGAVASKTALASTAWNSCMHQNCH